MLLPFRFISAHAVSKNSKASKTINHQGNLMSLLKLDLKYFPLFDQKFACFRSCHHFARLWFAVVFAVVETYWELAARFFLISVVGNKQITTSENGSSFGVVGDGELGKVKFILFVEVQGEDEGFELFVGTPVFLFPVPDQGSVASHDFPELVLD